MHPYHALTMRKGTSAPAPTIPANIDVFVDPVPRRTTGQASSFFSLNSDGSCSGTNPYTPGSWITPVGGSYGSSYWVIVTITSGAVASGTTGSRVAIGSGVSWSVITSGSDAIRSASALGTIQIWNAASGGTMVSSGSFYISASVDNS